LHYLLDLGKQISIEIDVKETIVLVEILLEILERLLVPVLKLPIIIALLLYGVIREVNVNVVEVIGVVLFA
jgi:hypothetical protein